ncbi:MAG TPA: acetyl-CoA carboxylase biotin carboxylase subunit [Xanthomonadales bacterium]|nr:acetyl-CoA carboxylase biotin carboxylase subunit [Xanthomonadales bacterium]
MSPTPAPPPPGNGFSSILVANRGEIACRVLRCARDLGYRTIAVYSEADRDAPHTALADEAVLIGPAAAGESYLDIGRVLEAAGRTGAGAIHPGYGFLSENAAFARACQDAGYCFIGPSAEAIELMGNKAAAKRCMLEAGVPCVPGYQGPEQDDAALSAAAEELGLPLMVKAAAGGGGRGMRLVRERRALSEAFRLARAEALGAFGSEELILEKALARPRHVEFQVFADRHGNVVHLGERDCSVQRRHQKVVEEAPCPVMDGELRQRMGAAAIEAARRIGYVGAGTVEFLLDADGAFYFLEMNTRLQVEHPVTELVTGLDLVELQIAVAQGEPLPPGLAEIPLRGHAIEARLYAEDPARDFMPCTGRIALWHPPAGAGVRVDAGIGTGSEISPFYDAMVAKVIAWGASREIARKRLLRALRETALFGVATNRDYLIRILADEVFAAGRATTAFITEQSGALEQAPLPAPLARAAVAAVFACRAQARRAAAAAVRVSPALLNWSSSGTLTSHCVMASGAHEQQLSITFMGGVYRVSDGQQHWVVEVLRDDGTAAAIVLDGAAHRVIYHAPGGAAAWIALGDCCERWVNRLTDRAVDAGAGGDRRVTAPMHGTLREINVAEGAAVVRGQALLVLEAMKMRHEVQAGIDGIVTSIRCHAGAQVAAGELLLEIEPAAAPPERPSEADMGV